MVGSVLKKGNIAISGDLRRFWGENIAIFCDFKEILGKISKKTYKIEEFAAPQLSNKHHI